MKTKDLIIGFAILAAIILFGMSMCSDGIESNRNAAEKEVASWYSGGTLHQSNAIEWQQASERDKLATCADLIAFMKEKDMLKDSIAYNINTVDDLKPFAEELKNNLNKAFQKIGSDAENVKIFTNQKVSDTSVMIATMNGWLK